MVDGPPPRAQPGLFLCSVQACGVASGAARPRSGPVHSRCSERAAAYRGGELRAPAGSPGVTFGAVCLFCDIKGSPRAIVPELKA